ncbi:hypothetical protein BsWGS_10896 [Bradybaena similaris]
MKRTINIAYMFLPEVCRDTARLTVSRRYPSRCFHGILVAYVITTAILIVSLLKKHTCFDIYSVNTLSDETIDHSLLAFLSSTRVVQSKIEGELARELSRTTNNTNFILDDLMALKTVIHQMEKHIDERAISIMLSKPVINYHNFSYTHNPTHLCTKSHVDVIIVIPSAASNFAKRMLARKGSRQEYIHNVENRAKMVFFLGSPPNESNSQNTQQNIDREVEEFGDVVQENFEDIYANNRLKSVSMLRWVSTYCSNARFVLRTDDDIEANISALVSVIHQTSKMLHNFIIGKKIINEAPKRGNSKYFISEQEYPYPVFPPFLLGGLLGYPVSTARRLYDAALRTRPIWLEDVYITGICASKMHVPILEHSEFLFKHE